MRSLFLVLFLGLAMRGSTALSILPKEGPNANHIFLPVGKSGELISLMDLSLIPRKQLEQVRGEKMNLFERLSFGSFQKKLRAGLNADGSFRSIYWRKAFHRKGKEHEFNTAGFLLGLTMSIYGVLIAYLIKSGRRKQRIHSAWIGAILGGILFLVFVSVYFSNLHGI